MNLSARSEESEGACIAVQEGGSADWTYLAVAEEAAEWDWSEVVFETISVMVGDAVEMLAAAEAGKQKCSFRFA